MWLNAVFIFLFRSETNRHVDCYWYTIIGARVLGLQLSVGSLCFQQTSCFVMTWENNIDECCMHTDASNNATPSLLNDWPWCWCCVSQMSVVQHYRNLVPTRAINIVAWLHIRSRRALSWLLLYTAPPYCYCNHCHVMRICLITFSIVVLGIRTTRAPR